MAGTAAHMAAAFSPEPCLDIESITWKNIIRSGAREMGLQIDDRAIDQFAVHAAELLKWNRKINLTAITDPLEMAAKHYLDSIAPSAMIPAHISLLDMGSGAGFPGIPLKIVNPSLSVTLIDASRKKISFLNHIIRRLGLRGTSAVQGRVEAMAPSTAHPGFGDPDWTGFNVIVCRALTDLSDFIRDAWPLLDEAGFLLAFKGRGEQAEKEIDCFVSQDHPPELLIAPKEIRIASRSYRLPYLGSERTIVRVSR